jgi:hypothetical protein
MVEWTREQMLMIRQPPDPNHSTESERMDGSGNIHRPANVHRPAHAHCSANIPPFANVHRSAGQATLSSMRHSFAFGDARIQPWNQNPVLRGGGDEKATWFQKFLSCFICCITSSSDEVDDPLIPAIDHQDDPRYDDNEINGNNEVSDHNGESIHEGSVSRADLEDHWMKLLRERPLSPLTKLSVSDYEDAQSEFEGPLFPVYSIENGLGSSYVNPDYMMSGALPVASPQGTEYFSPDSEEGGRSDERWRREERDRAGSPVITGLRGGGVVSSTRSMRAGQCCRQNVTSNPYLEPPKISRRTGRLAEPSERPRKPNKLYCLPRRNNAEDGTRSRRKWFKVKEDAAETWIGIKRNAYPRSTLLFLGGLLSTPFLGALDLIFAELDDENATYDNGYSDNRKAGLRTCTTKDGPVHKVPSIRITAPSPSPMLRGTRSS